MSVLVAGGITWKRVVVYNALAFALQFPLGGVMDKWPRFTQLWFFLGTGLVFAASVACAFGIGGWWCLVPACVGNALFHLTAGKHVLETHGGRAGPIGLFISTGALGLMAGQVWAAKAAEACLIVFALALAVCTTLVAILAWKGRVSEPLFSGVAKHAPAGKPVAIVPMLILAGLFVLIAWRSWAGMLAVGRSAGACTFMMLAGAAVTFAGKITGGYIAEHVGCLKVTMFSVAGSAALAFFCEPAWIAAWLVFLFVAQLATGPVLSLVYEKMDCRGGTAFGLNCLGLFVGGVV